MPRVSIFYDELAARKERGGVWVVGCEVEGLIVDFDLCVLSDGFVKTSENIAVCDEVASVLYRKYLNATLWLGGIYSVPGLVSI